MRSRSSRTPSTTRAVAPLARLLLRGRVAELGAHPVGHLDEVLALVAVLGRLLAAVAREQRRGERVELVAGVVQVVLAVHLGALRGEQVGDRVADRDPAPAAGVERAGRVRRDELEVDALAGQRSAWPYRSPCATTARSTSCSQVGREVEVDEARAGDLDPLEVRRALGLERDDDLRRDVARGHADGLRELQRDVGGEVAVTRAGGGRQLDAPVRHRKARGIERDVQRGEELVTDHRRSRRARRGFAAHGIDES